MDATRFDQIARSLTTAKSRRGMLAVLLALPLLIGLADADDANAQGRRRRRKKAHKHGRPRPHGKRKNHPCKPTSLAETCASACGAVKNACGKTVDCGSCDCDPPCGICFSCQGEPGAPGTCVPEAAGSSCGNPTTCDSGQLILGPMCDGSGTCQPGTPVLCPPYTGCNGDACAFPCRNDRDCFPVAHCDATGQCVPNTPP
jgi:hypothetical protein